MITAFLLSFKSLPKWCQRLVVPCVLAYTASYSTLFLYVATTNTAWNVLSAPGSGNLSAIVFVIPAWLAAFTRVKPVALVAVALYAIAGSVIYGFYPLSMWGLATQLMGFAGIFYVLFVQEQLLTEAHFPREISRRPGK